MTGAAPQDQDGLDPGVWFRARAASRAGALAVVKAAILRSLGPLPAVCALLLVPLAAAPAQQPLTYTFADEAAPTEYDVALTLPPTAGWPADRLLVVAFDYTDETHGHRLVCGDGRVRLERAGDDGWTSIGSAGTLAASAEPLGVTIKRRNWLIEVYVGSQLAATAFDSEVHGGKVGWAANDTSVRVEDLLVQEVVPIYFADDFMRDEAEPGQWVPLSGVWRYEGLAGGKGALKANWSANPFAYHAQAGTGTALAAAGEWFWDSYEYSAAIKPATEGAIGIACYVHDPRNYLLFRWTGSTASPTAARELVRVTDGTEQVLDHVAGGFRTDTWYGATIRAAAGHVEVLLDGQLALAADEPAFGQGRIGLWARDCASAWFDDVEVRPWQVFRDDLSAPLRGQWRLVSGQWQLGDGTLTSSPGGAVALTGDPQWHDYALSVDVGPTSSGFGLLVGARDDSNGYLLSHRRTGMAEYWQLERYADGQGTLVSQAEGSLNLRQPHHLTLEMIRGQFCAFVDGALVLEAADLTQTSGLVGLLASGQDPVVFDNVEVAFYGEPFRETKITEQFTQEASMSNWAQWQSAWRPEALGATRYWYHMPIWNSASVRTPLLSVGRQDAVTAVLFSAPATTPGGGQTAPETGQPGGPGPFSSFGSGRPAAPPGMMPPMIGPQQPFAEGRYRVAGGGPRPPGVRGFGWAEVVDEGPGFPAGVGAPGLWPTVVEVGTRAGRNDVTVVCYTANQLLGQAQVSVPQGPAVLRVDKDGHAVRVWLNDQPVLACLDATVLSNSLVGVAAQGTNLDLNQTTLYSRYQWDYCFAGAPTDWQPQFGLWQVTDRWSCTPGWAWFAGTKHPTPLLWSKRSFYGDQVLSFWAAVEMDAQGGGYPDPSDLNCTLCGDGASLDTGYSFVFAGEHNTKAYIARNGQVVAENPDGIFALASTGNNGFHHHWFHIQVAKRGAAVFMSVDGEPLLSWTDPDPLFGGRIGFWSRNNGILIARAKVAAGICD